MQIKRGEEENGEKLTFRARISIFFKNYWKWNFLRFYTMKKIPEESLQERQRSFKLHINNLSQFSLKKF